MKRKRQGLVSALQQHCISQALKVVYNFNVPGGVSIDLLCEPSKANIIIGSLIYID